MPISPIQAPQGAFDVVHRTLSKRASAAAFSLSKLSEADPRLLSIAMPHEVAFLDTSDLRRRKVRTKSKQEADCWRFLVLEGSEPVAAATAVRNKGGSFEFGGLNEGPLVNGTRQAVLQAEALDEVRDGQFQAALLVAPRLYVVALWLRNLSSPADQRRQGEADLLIAIPPANPALVPGEAMRPGLFFETLRRAQ